MKTRRALLKSVLAISAISSAATTKSQAIGATVQPIGVTGLLSLPFYEEAVRGKTIRFFVHMTVDGQSAPPGICLSIQQRIGSPTAVPCTVALRATDCAGWAEFDYLIPTNTSITTIYLSACYGGRRGPGLPYSASESFLQLVPLQTFGRKPI
jgi:hypothetical protein